MHQIQGVATACVINVVAAVVRLKPVIGSVVNALETEGWSHLVALSSVVIDYVKQHLNAGVVQSFDHGLELDQVTATQITRLRGEKA